jgi:hypothetical protein
MPRIAMPFSAVTRVRRPRRLSVLLAGVCLLVGATMQRADGAELSGVMMAGVRSQMRAADSLDYARFSQVLRRHVPEQLVQDIISKLPPNSKVYGFDIGDITGDSLADVLLSIRHDEARTRELEILVFVRMDERMERAASLRKRYVGEPIEVGFAVEDGICRITQKLADYAWNITGYTVSSLVFQETDAWNTHRVAAPGYAAYGVETVDDYRTLRTTETYYRLADARTVHRSSYRTVPVFPAGRSLPPMLTRMLVDDDAHGILSGSSSWFGADDCGLAIEGSWDSTAVTLRVHVSDERLLAADSTGGDRLELHLDRSGKPRIATNGKPRRFAADERVTLVLAMHDDGTVPRLVVASPVSERLAAALAACTVVRTAGSDGLQHVEIRIPKDILPARTQLPCTIVYRDHDNVDQPDWVTVRATSDGFEADDPGTYGRLDLVDASASRLVVEDMRLIPVRERLARVGVLR